VWEVVHERREGGIDIEKEMRLGHVDARDRQAPSPERFDAAGEHDFFNSSDR